MKKHSLFCFVLLILLALPGYMQSSNNQTMELISGRYKLVLYNDTGSFTLYWLSQTGKNRYEPLFDERNGSATSWFSVLSNEKIFKLAQRPGRPVKASLTEEGARFTFMPTDDFEVKQHFSFVPATPSGEGDYLLISTVLENTSGKPGTFAVKALLDTYLGEDTGIHFYSDARNRVSSETGIQFSRDKDTFIVSGSVDNKLIIPLLFGKVTKPELVVLSNWSRLNTLSWIPPIEEGRTFNTVFSVNDSAALLIWPEQRLEAGQRLQVNLVLSAFVPGKTKVAEAGESDSQKIERILARITEIEANPDSADDAELNALNEMLDQLLESSGTKR